ncbi:MAG TPA: MFS transporter [Candidatus Rubrimentiphilum sp.]|nr:MFS transporter [Candidatus Rubrimentiphilum sp.]
MKSTLASLNRHRWTICALLFVAMIINYMDRQSLALLKPTLTQLFHWNDIDYSNIVFAFTLAYGFGAIAMGRVMDYLGTKRGFSLSIAVWSLAEMAHAAVSTVAGFMGVRVVLGIGESASFPAAIKAAAEWFPARERAFATGLFNSGTAIGAIITPLLLPIVVLNFGWRAGFIGTGLLGFIWLAFWLFLHRKPEREKAIPLIPTKQERSKWIDVFPHRATWGFAIAKLLTDPVWTTIYLFWLPDFFSRTRQLDLKSFGLPLAMIYVCAALGSVAGGWLSSTLIKNGWSANRARKLTMLICALCVLPIAFATHIASLWLVVGVIGLAAGAHQGFSANLFTLTSDTFETKTVGSVVGIGQLAGSLGGLLAAKGMGFVLFYTNSYAFVFLFPAVAYLLALGVIQVLMPRLDKVKLGAS